MAGKRVAAESSRAAKKHRLGKASEAKPPESSSLTFDRLEGFASKIMQNSRCPITHQLMVDPVVAEDGHTYERSALVRWFATSKKSPVTNDIIGPSLVPAVAVRQTVSDLIDSSIPDTEACRQFYTSRGRFRAARTVPAPDLDGAAQDFGKAKGMAIDADDRHALEFQARVVSWMKQGQDLFKEASPSDKAKAAKLQDVREWLADVSIAIPSAVVSGRRLTSWLALASGTKVRVISDLAELRRLCGRSAPGAKSTVGWVDDMSTFAGQVCVVSERGSASHKNYHLEMEGSARRFAFPFDAVSLFD